MTIGRYEADGAINDWKAIKTHDIYKDVFTNATHQYIGSHDWKNGIFRLANPCNRDEKSSIRVIFKIPIRQIKYDYPSVRYLLRITYFAPMSTPPCLVTMRINEKEFVDEVQGEHNGRTTTDTLISFIQAEKNWCQVELSRGADGLFIEYFEILIQVDG